MTGGTREARYLIWSHENRGWWRQDGYGYVTSLSDAGIYSRAKALEICERAIPGTANRLSALPDLPVRLEDARMLANRFRATYPSMPPEAWE
jgi:hypothetical protein